MSKKSEAVIQEIDAINSTDPNQENVHGKPVPKELLYSQRMTERLFAFATDPSELLQIAARGQHIRRWEIPRSDYPMDRKGYLKWRTKLKLMHAEIVGQLMEKAGYQEAEIRSVQDLIMKKNLHKNPDTQTLEDVICLVFLEHYLDEFAQTKDDDKLVDILQKTWSKMSEKGHAAALKQPLSDKVKSLVSSALK